MEQRFEGRTWHLALGTWHSALGTWHLALGTWHLAPILEVKGGAVVRGHSFQFPVSSFDNYRLFYITRRRYSANFSRTKFKPTF